MSKIAGIDLGTTFSAIAVLNELGQPQIVPNADGERITPSVIYFNPDEKRVLFGAEAKNSRGTHPDRVFAKFKRNMHQPKDLFPPIEDRTHEMIQSFGEDSITPVYLSSMLLKKLVKDASHQESCEIKDVVISVPAWFKEAQRNATREAGLMAGLNVIALVNEPTAAALQYGSQGVTNGKVMVFDLGGGTFDVSILSIDGKEVTVLTSCGDPELGGCDFDLALVKHCEAKYRAEKSGDLYDDGFTREQLEADCEQLKKSLSKVSPQKVNIHGADGRVTITITAEEFAKLIDPYLSRIELLMESALHEVNLAPEDIDKTLLVGGSSRIPSVHDLVARVMGEKPETAPNVDEIVALGAAIRAGLEVKDSAPDKLTEAAKNELDSFDVIDVANSSFGTLTLSVPENGVINDVLIPKNTQLPHEVAKTYYTVSDDQSSIRCEVTQGESRHADDVDVIHNGLLELPAGRPAGQPIEISYSYDVSQRMHCRFKDVNSGKEHQVDLHPEDSEAPTDDLFDDLLID